MTTERVFFCFESQDLARASVVVERERHVSCPVELPVKEAGRANATDVPEDQSAVASAVGQAITVVLLIGGERRLGPVASCALAAGI